MGGLCLTQCEQVFLSALLNDKDNAQWADYLADQLRHAEITAKDYTGVGVFIDFQVDEAAVSVPLQKDAVPWEFSYGAAAPDRSDGVCLRLCTKESEKFGRILDYLEIFIFGDHYDEARACAWVNEAESTRP